MFNESSMTNLQVLLFVFGPQVLVVDLGPQVLVLVVEPYVLDNNTAE